MIEIEIDQEFDGFPEQIAVWEDETPYIIIDKGRRGGGSHVAARKFLKRIYEDYAKYKDKQEAGEVDGYYNIRREQFILRYWCVAPTYSLTSIQRSYIYSALREWGAEGLILYEQPSRNRLWLVPGILIEFKTGVNPDSLVSVGLNGIWITETARLKPLVWKNNVQPCISDNAGWLISDTSPQGANFYDEEIYIFALPTSDKYFPEKYSLHHWNSISNTFKPDLIAEVVAAKRTMPDKYYRRNYEASHDAFTGQIYDDFKESVHVRPFDFIAERYKVLIVGEDWGYTHKGVMILVGITYDDAVDIIDEQAESRVHAISPDKEGDSWMKRAKAWNSQYEIEMFYGGPDEPDHIEAFQYGGIRIVGADNSVSPGIQFVSTLMKIDDQGHSRYRIHPRCKNLIQNKKAQVWKPDQDGNDSEVPEKKTMIPMTRSDTLCIARAAGFRSLCCQRGKRKDKIA